MTAVADPRAVATDSKAWPFEEARKVVKRVAGKTPDKGHALFETGYGPSGLPHIGTFGEVVRTSMVRQAFETLCDVPTKLICFSDDMDGLRKVPANVPNPEMLAANLGKPLTRVPDPFGTHDSFGAHNNARLRGFLDSFGFEYEFLSSTEVYASGRFDAVLLKMLERHEAVKNVVLPTLGEERRASYSPFLPICPRTGVVLQVPILETKVDAGTVVYRDPETEDWVEVPVTGGACKMQWKADWAMRWVALEVDYEMAGKDLIDSVNLSGKIVRVLDARPPESLNYELFLDEKAEKISKSKGNGLTIEEWLRYAAPESLSYFMFQKPRQAKRLYFDVIPKAVDEYSQHLAAYPDQDAAKQLANPAWHIHKGMPPAHTAPVSFAMLLNLASVANAHDKAVLWGFINKYAPDASPETHPMLDAQVGYAIAYYEDFVRPAKAYRAPTDVERAALQELAAYLEGTAARDAETLQTEVYEIGKRHPFEALKDWFQALYQVLLGQTQGPRFGGFVALYGVEATAHLIRRALAGEDLAAG